MFHPFTSVVIVLGGEDQDPADPVLEPNNHGIFLSAIDLYIENYDVHMYDEDDVYPSGNGPVYEEIQSAINERGVIRVAIYGYSHGGGSTYDLAWALNENVIGNRSDINLPFTVPFTSYVDAITNTWIGAENRRPPLSQFHLNQYQRNLPLRGGPSNADDELNRTNINVDHYTIDDHATVLELLTIRFRQRVSR